MWPVIGRGSKPISEPDPQYRLAVVSSPHKRHILSRLLRQRCAARAARHNPCRTAFSSTRKLLGDAFPLQNALVFPAGLPRPARSASAFGLLAQPSSSSSRRRKLRQAACSRSASGLHFDRLALHPRGAGYSPLVVHRAHMGRLAPNPLAHQRPPSAVVVADDINHAVEVSGKAMIKAFPALPTDGRSSPDGASEARSSTSRRCPRNARSNFLHRADLGRHKHAASISDVHVERRIAPSRSELRNHHAHQALRGPHS